MASVAEITVYPNPVSDVLQVNFAGEQPPATLVLTDLLGNIVFTTNVNTSRFSIPVQQLPDGMYLLSVKTTDNNGFYKKIIKNTKE